MHFGSKGMLVVIVGAVKAEAAFEAWERAFGSWHGADAHAHREPVPPVPRLEAARREFAPIPGKTQSDLILGSVGPARADPDFWDANLGNTILGVFGLMGRLGTNVRDKLGLAYYSYSRVEGGVGAGPWSLVAGQSRQRQARRPAMRVNSASETRSWAVKNWQTTRPLSRAHSAQAGDE
jgi:zinc protease